MFKEDLKRVEKQCKQYIYLRMIAHQHLKFLFNAPLWIYIREK